MYLNIHRAIEAILELVPTATSLLATLLTKHFPFKGKSPETQVSNNYTKKDVFDTTNLSRRCLEGGGDSVQSRY